MKKYKNKHSLFKTTIIIEFIVTVIFEVFIREKTDDYRLIFNIISVVLGFIDLATVLLYTNYLNKNNH